MEKRRRGERLSGPSVRRANDFLYELLVDGLGLSPADARRVLGRRVSDRRRRDRRARVAPLADRYGVLACLRAALSEYQNAPQG